MKKIEAYYKKSFVIFFSVIFSVLFIFCACEIVRTVGAFFKGESVKNHGGLPILILFLVTIPIVVVKLLEPCVTADENGIVHMCRRGKITVSWDCIKRLYLTEDDVLQIEVTDDYLKNFTSAERFDTWLVKKMGGEAVQISLVTLDVDALKFTYELQNMLEEYKNAG